MQETIGRSCLEDDRGRGGPRSAGSPRGGAVCTAGAARPRGRYASTASTRRWSSTVGGRSSLEKIEVTCFSTARSVTTSASAMALLERPSAISPSTSRSRAVRLSSGSSRRRRPEQQRDDLGVQRGAAVGDAAHGVGERVHVGDAVLEQVARALGGLRQQVQRVGLLDVLGEHEHAGVRAARRGSGARRAGPRRCAWAASARPRPRRRACGRRPCASGPRRRRPGRRRRSRTPRAGGTRPSRRRTESSATTTRRGALIAGWSLVAAAARASGQEFLDAVAGQLGLGHEAARARARHERAEVRAVAAGDEDHGRGVVGARSAAPRRRSRRCRGAARRAARPRGGGGPASVSAWRAVGGLADHVEALGFEQNARAGAKRRVVVDDEDPWTHGCQCDRGRERRTVRLAVPVGTAGSPSVTRPGRLDRGRDLAHRLAGIVRAEHRGAGDEQRRPGLRARGRRRRRRSRRRPRARSRRRGGRAAARACAGEAGRNAWPPQPGFTVMQRTRSTSRPRPATASGGVRGLSARPARQPASRTAASA